MNRHIFPPAQVFFNWKNQLRTRAKKLKQIQDGKTGADDKLALQKLTDVEKRALKLWREDFQDKDIASVSFLTEIFILSINFPPLPLWFVSHFARYYILSISNFHTTPEHVAHSSNRFYIEIFRQDEKKQKQETLNIFLEAYASYFPIAGEETFVGFESGKKKQIFFF